MAHEEDEEFQVTVHTYELAILKYWLRGLQSTLPEGSGPEGAIIRGFTAGALADLEAGRLTDMAYIVAVGKRLTQQMGEEVLELAPVH